MKLLHNLSYGPLDERAIRDGFGDGMVELGKRDPRVVALTADLTESTRLDRFAEAYPDRFFEIGVAEQNMIGVAAGLAHEGFTPFAASYAVFSPGRTLDQIRLSVSYSNNNVKIVGSHAGLSVGPDGATHQALEDVALMRTLPGMTVVVPCDANEAKKATLALAAHRGPAYLRLGREKVATLTTERTPFEIGKALSLTHGTDVTVIANGPMVFPAVQAAHELDGKYSVRVLNFHTVKPLDHVALLSAARETGAIVTAEDHQIYGGLGSAVAEFVSAHHPVPVIPVGMRDMFGESGSAQELMQRFHLTSAAIVEAIIQAIKVRDAR
jgi:transketolase